MLNPIQNSTETSSTDLFSVIDGGLQGMGDITLDCFALELGGSSHYLIYIAGQWFISFCNFFKFFSEDYRRANIHTIMSKVKDMDKKGKKFFVKGEHVADLIVEVYPMWLTYGKKILRKTNFMISNRFNKS